DLFGTRQHIVQEAFRMQPVGRAGSSRFSIVFRFIVVAGLALIVIIPLTYPRSGKPLNRNLPGPATRQQKPAGRAIQSGGAERATKVSAAGMRQIAALLAEKESRTPAQKKIDSQLLQAFRESRGQQMAAGVSLAPSAVQAEKSGMLMVDISADVTDSLIERIKSTGGEIVYPSAEYKTIRARINLSDVETIAGYSEVRFIQAAIPSITHEMSDPNRNLAANTNDRLNIIRSLASNPGIDETVRHTSFAERSENVRKKLSSYFGLSPTATFFTGNFESEGDRAHRADDVRATFGYAGEGVRIGVLSDSFNNRNRLSDLVGLGNLPGPGNPLGNVTPVTVVQDFPFNGTDEGAAMLEIIHDIAPKAQLFFATASLSEASFATNILALRNAPFNCDIIVDDVGY